MVDNKDMFKRLLDGVEENIQKKQAKQAKESMDEFSMAMSEMAKYTRITYQAFKDAGFTDGQAYTLTVDMMLAWTIGQEDYEDE